MNCMRIPALQSLLLYARILDTNADCTRVLVDEWLEVRFLNEETAQKIVSAVLSLRTSIDKLFKIRLEDRHKLFANSADNADIVDDTEARDDEDFDRHERRTRAKRLERLLKKKLSEFLDSSVLYALRRVLPAELNTIYVKQFQQHEAAVPAQDVTCSLIKQIAEDKNKLVANETKGGYRITEYLNYNWYERRLFYKQKIFHVNFGLILSGSIVSDATLSITGEYSGQMQRHWKCSHCLKEFMFNLKERMEHDVFCQANSKNKVF